MEPLCRICGQPMRGCICSDEDFEDDGETIFDDDTDYDSEQFEQQFK